MESPTDIFTTIENYQEKTKKKKKRNSAKRDWNNDEPLFMNRCTIHFFPPHSKKFVITIACLLSMWVRNSKKLRGKEEHKREFKQPIPEEK